MKIYFWSAWNFATEEIIGVNSLLNTDMLMGDFFCVILEVPQLWITVLFQERKVS